MIRRLWILGTATFVLASVAVIFGEFGAYGDRATMPTATMELSFDSTDYDAGAVRQVGHPIIRHVFVLKNISSHAITIRDIKTTCACTRATPSKSTLQPGDTGELAAEMKIGSLGENAAEIVLFINAEAAPIRLTVCANFLPDAFASAAPSRMELETGGLAPASVSVNVFTSSAQEPTITGITSTIQSVTAVMKSHSRSNWRGDAGYICTSYNVVVNTRADSSNPSDGELVVSFSPPQIAQLHIPFSVGHLAEIEATPSKLIFISGSTVPQGAQKVLVRCAGGADASVDHVENPDSDWLDVVTSSSSDGTLVLQFQPRARLILQCPDRCVDFNLRSKTWTKQISVPIEVRSLN